MTFADHLSRLETGQPAFSAPGNVAKVRAVLLAAHHDKTLPPMAAFPDLAGWAATYVGLGFESTAALIWSDFEAAVAIETDRHQRAEIDAQIACFAQTLNVLANQAGTRDFVDPPLPATRQEAIAALSHMIQLLTLDSNVPLTRHEIKLLSGVLMAVGTKFLNPYHLALADA
jgi:hypothetical protein